MAFLRVRFPDRRYLLPNLGLIVPHIILAIGCNWIQQEEVLKNRLKMKFCDRPANSSLLRIIPWNYIAAALWKFSNNLSFVLLPVAAHLHSKVCDISLSWRAEYGYANDNHCFIFDSYLFTAVSACPTAKTWTSIVPLGTRVQVSSYWSWCYKNKRLANVRHF